MKFLVPLVLALAGTGAGVGAGVFLRPGAGDGPAGAGAHAGADAEAAPADSHGEDKSGDAHVEASSHAGPAAGRGGSGGEQYVKLGNQFIVPVLAESRVRSLVVLSIDLEVGAGGASAVYRVEPKIRDAFLTVLFDHANAGGFDGTFTSSGSMEILRRSLREAGRKAVGENVISDVLITGIVRQDV